MVRAVKISLEAATAKKLAQLEALRREVLSCTQAYIDLCWTGTGGFTAATMNLIKRPELSYRHRSNCLKVALETISATRKAAKATGKKCSKPTMHGTMRLSSLVAKIERGRGSFDYVLKVSGLSSGNPIVIPFKSHKRLNYWLAKPGAKLLQGCNLGPNWASLWIRIPEETEKPGATLGVDVGINKLLVDSNNNKYGTDIKAVCARVRRCKPGSKGRIRAAAARKNYINSEVKKLPWGSLGVLGVENLVGLKTGKKKGRSKEFRRMIAPWTFRQAVTRIELLAQENRVRLVAVDPRNTSRTCPSCGSVAKENRKGESFQCVRCNYSADADHVGALNVLARTFGNSQVSMVPAQPSG